MNNGIAVIVAGAVVAGAFFAGGDGTSLNSIGTGAEEKTPTRSAPTRPSAGGQFTTTRAPDGHFYAEARINGRNVQMMIDTGASSVVLSRSDAQRIGIDVDKARFTENASTAGGNIAIMPVTLGSMSLGSLTERNVPAFVANSELQISLVGQSFLQRVDSVEIAGDQIRLR